MESRIRTAFQVLSAPHLGTFASVHKMWAICTVLTGSLDVLAFWGLGFYYTNLGGGGDTDIQSIALTDLCWGCW